MRHLIKKLFSANPPKRRDENDYGERVRSEVERYAQCDNVHDLPEIFHYWSNRYLAPAFRDWGFGSPDDFFQQQMIGRCAARPDHAFRMISIGSGNCDLEARLAQGLLAAGHRNFSIECLDLNEHMIERGRAHARECGVSEHIGFVQGDFNHWTGERNGYDIVMANQSLHHVLELEHLFDAIHRSLRDDGVFLISDMIGRNGHMRWPEALEAMQPFWDELPESYRYNQQLQRPEPEFVNYDCSVSGFEGIRAQDILPLLCERFGFQLFFPYGNIVFPFIDRAFGHNFDAQAEWDRDFVDRVHERDEEGMRAGELTPTAMIAAVARSAKETRLRDPLLTPERCVRHP